MMCFDRHFMGLLLLSAGSIGSSSAVWSWIVETGDVGPKLMTSIGSSCYSKRDSEVFSYRFTMFTAATVSDV